MSTNGIIARSTGEGTFAGRYHHWDSYCFGLGVALIELYRGHFKHDLTRMLQVLLDEHPAGWSTIVHKDFTLKPGYTNVAQRPEGMPIEEFQNQPLNRRPHCYCHGHRHEEGWIADEKTDCGASWAYVFDEDNKTLHILGRQKHEVSGEYHWQEVGRIELDSEDQTNWTAIECGENFERCSHYAWYHNLLPKTSRLGTQTWLGNRPLEFHDAVAFLVGSKRYANSGSGGNSDYLRKMAGKNFPPDTWVSSVVAGNGRRLEIATAKITSDGYVPMDGITWIYPPTKQTNGRETKVWGGKG
jgi:hypothetical protein